MDSIPDKVLNGTWQSAYALTSISVGAALVLQNKSSSGVLVFISAAAPSANATDGYVVRSGETVVIDAGESGCWLKGTGPVSIQNG